MKSSTCFRLLTFIVLASLLLLPVSAGAQVPDRAAVGGLPLSSRPRKNPLTTRPPAPKDYCWNTRGDIHGPSEPLEPFLYQPFEGTFSEKTWTAQMDHDQPSYVGGRNGVIATLGEMLKYDVHRPGLAGGTVAANRWITQWFPYDVPYSTVVAKGFSILAYQSPSFEYYLYYDGHDGHDFAVGGKALAAAEGIVVFARTYSDTLGRVIEIYHPQQGYLTRYAHLASFEVKEGEWVQAGQPVGVIGGSAILGGKLKDNHWGIHLHFSVFRWNEEPGAWQITDPFGWDPWAGPDWERRWQKQREDPLAKCNGEVSYTLWVDEWPHLPDGAPTGPVQPTQDRYVGGWIGEEEGAMPVVSEEPGPAPSPAPPGGGRIAFTSDRDGNDEIYVMNADGSGLTNLTNNPAWDGGPAWSPDGRRIAFTRVEDTDGDGRIGNFEDAGEIYVMNADGSGLANLTNNPAPDFYPAWSP